ncbi:hypothetical protein [Pseudobutyrivibrio xylanivorans]|nr:hypothetical protein [Pseudobutyrivibrio xylanivorans]
MSRIKDIGCWAVLSSIFIRGEKVMNKKDKMTVENFVSTGMDL